jgi:ribosomal protein L31
MNFRNSHPFYSGITKAVNTYYDKSKKGNYENSILCTDAVCDWIG